MTELSKATKLSWRKILISDAGKEGMLVLRENCPPIVGMGDAHTIVFKAGVVAGYDLALKQIYELASAEKEISAEELEPK